MLRMLEIVLSTNSLSLRWYCVDTFLAGRFVWCSFMLKVLPGILKVSLFFDTFFSYIFLFYFFIFLIFFLLKFLYHLNMNRSLTKDSLVKRPLKVSSFLYRSFEIYISYQSRWSLLQDHLPKGRLLQWFGVCTSIGYNQQCVQLQNGDLQTINRKLITFNQLSNNFYF